MEDTLNIGIDIVDEKLRASRIQRPGTTPDLEFRIEGLDVDVWLNREASHLCQRGAITEDEILDLVWLMVVTQGSHN
jgi:hypothetical protein